MDLISRAKSILDSSAEWEKLVKDAQEAIQEVHEKRQQIILSQPHLDELSGTLLSFTNTLERIGRINALTRYVARGMEFRHKRNQYKVKRDGMESQKKSGVLADTYRYTETEDSFEDYNQAQLLQDAVYSAWEVAKDTSQAARSKLSYEKGIAQTFHSQ